jgi:hypothetical protein
MDPSADQIRRPREQPVEQRPGIAERATRRRHDVPLADMAGRWLGATRPVGKKLGLSHIAPGRADRRGFKNPSRAL